jgi:hypothetical protein
MGTAERNERTFPSNWWYAPPVVAGVFFVLVTAVLSPFIPNIFCAVCIPLGVLAYVFGYSIAKESFNQTKRVAKSWAWIACAWISVIAWYVVSSLFWCELIGC